MKVFKISLYESANPLIVDSISAVYEMLEFEEFEIGQTITIEVQEMEESKFYNLPEWDGP